ncbi:unnamed protein product [Miscanthus lutarioriparius]|uniref:C2H2-type domain-containing protein n=1 Tax=Miscanthus lutarioriparius TaxID=422564 RepID=A0A811PNI3_9POAL|nr:unnamed protein product [Miscanthus lutarioriparius]
MHPTDPEAGPEQESPAEAVPLAAAAPAPVKKKRTSPGRQVYPDAEVIALSPGTLLATNRFVCEVCGKGFQRDQNLQLHHRGHNLPWRLGLRVPRARLRAPLPGASARRPHRDQEALLPKARGEALGLPALRQALRRPGRAQGARQDLRHPRVPLRQRHALHQFVCGDVSLDS